jgi:purine-binding chemotaxis protein CheW
MSREALDKVFAARARRLAMPRDDGDHAQGEAILAFRIGAERYGLPLSRLAEVLPLDKWVKVPGMPDSLLGVMNLRGEIRPVLNLHVLLSVGEAAPAEDPLVLFLRGQTLEIGLRIDAIDRVTHADQGAQAGDSAALLGRYVTGMTADDVILIDIDQLFALDIFRDVVAENSRTA